MRILYLEDEPKDAELVQASLEAEGLVCDLTCADTQASFLTQLQQGGLDLILADYTLPLFDGISALKIAQEIRPEVNFIFVSGTMGEELAIEALKMGATDYVFKTRLSRLAPSVRRALREATERSERRRAEEALQRNEAYFAEAQRLSHTGSFGWQVASGRIQWSDETYRIFGFELGVQPTLELAFERIHPQDRQLVREVINSAAQEEKDFDVEHRLLMPDGSAKHVRVVGHPSARAGSDDLEFVGAVTDITDRKRASDALRRSEAYLSAAQRLSHTGSFGWDVSSGEIYWSRETFEIFGYEPTVKITIELIMQRTHPEDRSAVQQLVDRVSRDRTEFDFEHRLLMPDGSVKYVRVVGRPSIDERGRFGFVGALTDVTERKQAEEERERLRQAQADLAHVTRVSTMVKLTASLAHEVNQPIAAAVTNSNTCLRWLTRDPPDIEEAREAASRSVKDATRAADIIKRVRLQFKRGIPQREPVDVNEVIRDVIVLLRNEAYRYSVSTHTDLATDLSKVIADRVQLHQVFTNLMLNGIEAMKDTNAARELTIKSEQAENSHLLISVSDTGVGLSPEQADQIFDAFFTTKTNGTGMGLTVSRSIVEDHGGRLWATANQPRGAVFQFTLPAKDERMPS